MSVNLMELWRAIGRLEAERNANEDRLERIEEQVSEIKLQLGTLMTWATRGGLLAMLWTGVVLLNLSGEQKAELLSAVVSHLKK